MDVGKRLTQLREKAGLSQYKLSKAAGIPQQSISRYESGYNIPTVTQLEKLCTALNVSLAEFFGGAADEWQPVSVGMEDGSTIDISDLSDEQRKELRSYLEFLRSRKM